VEPPAAAAKPTGLAAGEVAILGMALTKLIFEASELALHNPTISAHGKQPEFKLDERGRPPAMSLAHVVAATRLVRAHLAERERLEPAPPPATPRARLQAARSARYATTARYAYVPAPSTYRTPR
jgi:hypothetical protein